MTAASAVVPSAAVSATAVSATAVSATAVSGAAVVAELSSSLPQAAKVNASAVTTVARASRRVMLWVPFMLSVRSIATISFQDDLGRLMGTGLVGSLISVVR